MDFCFFVSLLFHILLFMLTLMVAWVALGSPELNNLWLCTYFNLWDSHSPKLGKLSSREDLFLLLPVAKVANILGQLQNLGSVHPSKPMFGASIHLLIVVSLLSSFPSWQLWFCFCFWRGKVCRNLLYLLRDQQCLKEMGSTQGLLVP